ncbi:NYN domain-containing protein [Geofilum rubicundum]|uniref:Maebl n=1 Tax=Geofilum rubicundum JCM 15548 TaxID=1236989 RepID=A0A0E9LX99_9BACT|nr:NYN domain-containing protein [Geofilum rubicundum]GAO29776.1 Maebl [Geofilum rubicundum JCM 15548]
MKTNEELRLAVLIDGDNIPYANIKEMMEEIAKFGVPTFKRIYGDWTKPQLGGWKGVLLENAIHPIQQYGYTTGKNATDSAMIIDAMDILYSGKVDGFCLVSSDSDFTRLATRLRESGMKVIGIGERKTPSPFIVACDKFIYLEILRLQDEKEPGKTTKDKPSTPVQVIDNKLLKLIKSSVNDLADDDGWAFLGEIGQMLNKKRPDFDPRNYGFTRLTPLLKSLKKNFEVDERISGKSNAKQVYVKNKGK